MPPETTELQRDVEFTQKIKKPTQSPNNESPFALPIPPEQNPNNDPQSAAPNLLAPNPSTGVPFANMSFGSGTAGGDAADPSHSQPAPTDQMGEIPESQKPDDDTKYPVTSPISPSHTLGE